MTGCVLSLPRVRFDPDQVVVGEEPLGDRNCVNVDYATAREFLPQTIEVLVDGTVLVRDLDYTVGADNKSFSLIIQASDSNRLNQPLSPSEDLRCNYVTAAPSGCVGVL